VSSFAAQTTFKDVQARFPDYTYCEPTLNPTALTDRPADWEADYVNTFRNNAGVTELVGQRDAPTGPSLSLARPIAIDSADCLTCHSTPARAPAAMVATYGGANGFGWKLHEIVGAQVVSVPMALPMQQARQMFIAFMAIMVAMFVVIPRLSGRIFACTKRTALILLRFRRLATSPDMRGAMPCPTTIAFLLAC
jgi:Protein of unknown function (DUF3365)